MPLTRAMAAVQATENSTIVDSKPSERPPKRKRMQDMKTTQVPKRTKKASLSRLLDMPPEVFNQIATHLHPADLLSLARSNKFFRKVLMARTSQHIWKQALANLPDIPAYPLELDEPQAVERGLFVEWIHFSSFDYVAHAVMNIIKEPLFGRAYTFKDELFEFTAVGQINLDDEWISTRVAEVEKRQTFGGELEEYLDILEEEREVELEELKAKRRNDIEVRLFEEGWMKQSMVPSYNNSAEWNRLVMQPRPLTDRIWNNLYPKLTPLLVSNQAHNERVNRIEMIEALVKDIREALPPLVHLTHKTSTSENEAIALSTPSASSSARNSDVKVQLPFPSTKELLTCPMINSIVDDDLSPEEAETRFNGIRDEFDQAVVDWREAIERELVAIWNTNREDEAEPEASTGKGEGKGKATAQ